MHNKTKINKPVMSKEEAMLAVHQGLNIPEQDLLTTIRVLQEHRNQAALAGVHGNMEENAKEFCNKFFEDLTGVLIKIEAGYKPPTTLDITVLDLTKYNPALIDEIEELCETIQSMRADNDVCAEKEISPSYFEGDFKEATDDLSKLISSAGLTEDEVDELADYAVDLSNGDE